MLVEGNTVIATGASGIVNNDASFNNTFATTSSTIARKDWGLPNGLMWERSMDCW
jgi:hypothetical protein